MHRGREKLNITRLTFTQVHLLESKNSIIGFYVYSQIIP
jgi:hypothetical protein